MKIRALLGFIIITAISNLNAAFLKLKLADDTTVKVSEKFVSHCVVLEKIHKLIKSRKAVPCGSSQITAEMIGLLQDFTKSKSLPNPDYGNKLAKLLIAADYFDHRDLNLMYRLVCNHINQQHLSDLNLFSSFYSHHGLNFFEKCNPQGGLEEIYHDPVRTRVMREFFERHALWKCQTLYELPGFGSIRKVEFKPDGTQAAIEVGNIFSVEILLKDLKDINTKKVHYLKKNLSFVRSIKFSLDGTHIGVLTESGQVGVWNSHTKELLSSFDGFNCFSIAFSPDGKTLAGVCGNKTMRLWDVSTTELIQSYEDVCSGVSFSPQGDQIVTMSNPKTPERWDFKTVKVWDAKTGRLLHSLDLGDSYYIQSAVFSSDNILLLVFREKMYGDSYYDVTLWDLKESKSTSILEKTSVDVPPSVANDGVIVIVSDKRIKLFDGLTQSVLQGMSVNGSVKSVSISKDGKQLVAVVNENVFINGRGSGYVSRVYLWTKPQWSDNFTEMSVKKFFEECYKEYPSIKDKSRHLSP